jgi:hypothetical protein
VGGILVDDLTSLENGIGWKRKKKWEGRRRGSVVKWGAFSHPVKRC